MGHLNLLTRHGVGVTLGQAASDEQVLHPPVFLGNCPSNNSPSSTTSGSLKYVTYVQYIEPGRGRYDAAMTTRHFASYTAARAQFRDLLDVAHTGRVTTVERDRERFAVVDAEVLRGELAALRPARAVVAAEGGGWSAFLPGVPVSGEGDDLDGALEDLIEALREYAVDWNERLLDAPNHRGNWALVALTELSDDAQLKRWLLDGEMPTPT